MKKSKVVKLVLVAGLMGSCGPDKHKDTSGDGRLWVRGDSASRYSHAPHATGGHYFHYMPFGYYHPSYGYRRGGYESPGFSSKATGPGVSRGGFGSSGFRVGS